MNKMLINYAISVPTTNQKPNMYLGLNAVHRKRSAFMMDYGGMVLGPYCDDCDTDIAVMTSCPSVNNKTEVVMSISYITTLEGTP